VTLRRASLPAALVGLPLTLLLTGCAGKAADPAAGSPSSSASVTPSAGTEQRIAVTFEHGEAAGDTGRVQVAEGTSITLVVTSDTADEVHVHGYDVEKALSPGTPATLQFTADVAGVFEVELHHAGTVLLRLQVS
jgi:hypothetical protein